ncbi:MAG: DUF4261 domain-containing protein [Saprospiraceae bacterium]
MYKSCLLATFGVLLCINLCAQKTKPAENKAVSGIVLLNEKKAVDFSGLTSAIKKDWGVRLDSSNVSGKNLTLYTTGATIMLAYTDYPAAPAEIRSAAEGAWMWLAAKSEAPKHLAQVVVTVVGAPNKALQLYKLYTRVVAAVLDNTRSCAIYLPGQYLLQSKAFFLQAARNLDQNTLPIYCWVYFGMFQDGGQACAYTYGLPEFGMTDLEIVKSNHTLQEAHAVLYDAAKDALQNNRVLQDGSVLETLEGKKYTLSMSVSPYLQGRQTLKMAY